MYNSALCKLPERSCIGRPVVRGHLYSNQTMERMFEGSWFNCHQEKKNCLSTKHLYWHWDVSTLVSSWYHGLFLKGQISQGVKPTKVMNV
jgi:hypothetical protein